MQDTDYQLFASSVEEELSLGMKDDCKEKVDETLKALELSDYRERHPASLSGGQKERVTIGAAIVKGSPVIYFDEPTSCLVYTSRCVEETGPAMMTRTASGSTNGVTMEMTAPRWPILLRLLTVLHK